MGSSGITVKSESRPDYAVNVSSNRDHNHPGGVLSSRSQDPPPTTTTTPLPSDFIRRSLKCCSFTWVIEDFRRRREKPGEPIVSPVFVAEDENSNIVQGLEDSSLGPSFKCFFYPNGTGDEPDQTAFFLWIEESSQPEFVKARFSVAILDKIGEAKVKKICPFMLKGLHQRAGWHKFFPKRKLLDSLNQLIVNGQVTFVVDVFFSEDDISLEQVNSIFNLASVFCPRTKSGSEEFRRLYEEKQFDLCIKTREGRNIPAHRVVLSATSHVLEKHLIRDRRTFLLIDDFDSKVVQDAIFFMYHRTFESDEPDFKGLLKFAEIYKVPALKFAVEQELYESVMFDNALDLYSLAGECNSTLLLEALKYVIVENCQSITETAGWKKLLMTDHKMVTHLFNVLADEICRRMGGGR